MVYINSCKNCKTDCENGMRLSGNAYKSFTGNYVVDYFCNQHQGIFQVSLDDARKYYGFKGRTFEETDIVGDYKCFQDIVENLSVLDKPFTTTEHTSTEGKYVEFKVYLSDYAVFQIKSATHTIHNGYFQGKHNEHIVAYCDKIRITEKGELIGFLNHREVVKLIKNHFNKDDFKETRYNVYFKHLK